MTSLLLSAMHFQVGLPDFQDGPDVLGSRDEQDVCEGWRLGIRRVRALADYRRRQIGADHFELQVQRWVGKSGQSQRGRRPPI